MNVGDNSSLGDGDSIKHLAQLLVVPDGKLEVARDDPGLLVVPGSVPSQLEDLGSEVLQDSCEEDRSSTSNPGGEVSLAEMAEDPSNWELESSSLGLRHLLSLGTSCFTSRHGDQFLLVVRT